MFAAGVRAHYVSSQLGAKLMVPRRTGLMVNISFWSAQKHISNVAYGVAKAATDKMVKDMAHELLPFNVAAVAALASDPHVIRKSGTILHTAELAKEYGFTDTDGTQPRPVTLEEA